MVDGSGLGVMGEPRVVRLGLAGLVPWAQASRKFRKCIGELRGHAALTHGDFAAILNLFIISGHHILEWVRSSQAGGKNEDRNGTHLEDNWECCKK